VLILVTPVLLGRPSSELASLPMLIVGWSGNQSYLIVYATGALQQYQYKLIRLAFNESTSSVNGTFRENDTYGFHRWVPANASFLIASCFTFVVALVVVSILSIIGAVFVGMFVSHRILSGKGFTPFEQEMLRMRQDVRELTDRVEEIAARIGVSLGDRKKEP